jgi:hypothetical protein
VDVSSAVHCDFFNFFQFFSLFSRFFGGYRLTGFWGCGINRGVALKAGRDWRKIKDDYGKESVEYA